MALYTYVPGKAELLDLMLDTVYGEQPTPDPTTDGWRAAAEAWARGTWDFYRRHPWVLQVAGARPVLGPHELDGYEALLRIFDGLGLPAVEVARAANSLAGFVRGGAKAVSDATRRRTGDRRERRRLVDGALAAARRGGRRRLGHPLPGLDPAERGPGVRPARPAGRLAALHRAGRVRRVRVRPAAAPRRLRRPHRRGAAGTPPAAGAPPLPSLHVRWPTSRCCRVGSPTPAPSSATAPTCCARRTRTRRRSTTSSVPARRGLRGGEPADRHRPRRPRAPGVHRRRRRRPAVPRVGRVGHGAGHRGGAAPTPPRRQRALRPAARRDVEHRDGGSRRRRRRRRPTSSCATTTCASRTSSTATGWRSACSTSTSRHRAAGSTTWRRSPG